MGIMAVFETKSLQSKTFLTPVDEAITEHQQVDATILLHTQLIGGQKERMRRDQTIRVTLHTYHQLLETRLRIIATALWSETEY